VTNYHYTGLPEQNTIMEDSNSIAIRVARERDFYKGLLLAEYSAEELEEMFNQYLKMKATR